MPFTLSHPAAVLPLLRRPFVPVALITGAMVPDLPYFLNVQVTAQSWYEPFVNATFSHSAPGLLLVGLPSVVLVASLSLLVKGPIADLLPLRLHINDRNGAMRRSAFSFCIWFLISAVLGMATHILWDSLTEGGGWVVSHLPFLHADPNTGRTFSRILQHGSSLLGMVFLVVWYMRRFHYRGLSIERLTVSKRRSLQHVGMALSIISISAAYAFLAVKQGHNREGSVGLELVLTMFVKSGMRAAAVAVVLYACTWHGLRLFKTLLPPKESLPGSRS